MSKFEKLSLQWRVTIMTVVILVCCVAIFAIFTMLVARNSFKPVAFDENMLGDVSIQSGTNINMEEGTDIVYTFVDQFSEQALLSYQHSSNIFNTISIVLCIMIIICGSVMVYFLTKKALSPISELSTQLSSIDEENISERLISKFGDEQIVSLTESFNHVLDRLEDAFERQRLFSANASHELKTPLAVMKAGIQILKIDEDTSLDEYKENAQMMEESVNRLIKVTDSLMLLSFLGEEQPCVDEEINIKDMIDSIIEELSMVYSSLMVDVENNTTDIVIFGNTMLIYRAIYNLIENAYKYNVDKGYIKISNNIDNVADKLILEICNSGQVVPKESLEVLFDAFYRLDTSRSHKKEGSGLGLSIVKSIVDFHKGAVKIDTMEFGGLMVSIKLPVKQI